MILLIIKRSDGILQKEIRDVFSVENSLHTDIAGNSYMEITVKLKNGDLKIFDTDKDNNLIVSEEELISQ